MREAGCRQRTLFLHVYAITEALAAIRPTCFLAAETAVAVAQTVGARYVHFNRIVGRAGAAGRVNSATYRLSLDLQRSLGAAGHAIDSSLFESPSTDAMRRGRHRHASPL